RCGHRRRGGSDSREARLTVEWPGSVGPWTYSGGKPHNTPGTPRRLPRVKNPMSLALSTLLYEWRRYLAAVIALAVAGLLVLSMTGMFMGMVRSFAAPVDRSPAEIMILPPEANSLFDHNSGQPRRLIPLIYRDPEVLEVPDVHVGQAAEIVSEADPTQVARGRVLRIAGAF